VIYLDLLLNLAMLVALSIVSGFIDVRWPRRSRVGMLLQGVLFGGASVAGMLRPLRLGPGLIFDGRSVLVSLCALYFGPWAGAVAVAMTLGCRLWLGGAGVVTGSLVILSSASIGLLGRLGLKPEDHPPSSPTLYLLGLSVHLVMLLLMFTLPGGVALEVIRRIGLPVMLLYPLATVLTGKILSDQLDARQLMRALQEREQRYVRLFNGGNDAIFVHPLDQGWSGTFVEVNDVACLRLGYSREELLRLSFEDLDAGGPDETMRLAMEQVARVGHAVFEMAHRTKSGEVIPAEMSSRAFESGGQRQVLSIARDITERKQAEEALRQNEERLSIAFDSDAAGRTFTGVDGRLLHVNARLCEMLGYSAEEITARSFSDLTHPEDQALSRECVRSMLAGEQSSCRFEKRYLRKDGSVLWADVTTALILDTEGRPQHFVTGIQDITLRKRADAQLQEKMRELQRFQDLVVGRELLMIELKREVNALRVQAGQDEKYRIDENDPRRHETPRP